MMGRTRIFVATLALAGVCLGGCVARSPSPSLWQIEPVVAMPDGWDAQAPSVFVGAVEVPRYLDRPEILQRTGPGRLEPEPFARWAEPMDDAVTRVIAEELARRLGSEKVVAYPAQARFEVAYQVVVDLERLDGRVGEAVHLVARWSVLEGVGGPALRTEREDIRVEAGDDVAGFVAAHGQALSELAARIAATLDSLAAVRGS